MSTWLSSVVLPIGVSVATVIVLGLTVGPRLAARAKRIQTAFESRDQFGDSVLDLLALCGNLEKVVIPPDVGDPLKSRLQSERGRWLAQIDEITTWLLDHWQRVALGYAGAMGVRFMTRISLVSFSLMRACRARTSLART